MARTSINASVFPRSATAGASHSALRPRALVELFINWVAPCPWGTSAGAVHSFEARPRASAGPLYSPDERRRRDASPWTIVQGVLAPIQFLIFLISLGLVLTFLATGEGYAWATASIVLKTLALYAIMVTGSIWEKEVFGKYLFAPAFFWEDVFSMLVLALHTAYLAMIGFGLGTPADQMLLALAAYVAYLINAIQFLLKLRTARLEAAAMPFANSSVQRSLG